MIQLDALSRWPDYIPDEDNDNVDRVLLPESMFVNLMDLDLQDRIANTDKYDYDVLCFHNSCQLHLHLHLSCDYLSTNSVPRCTTVGYHIIFVPLFTQTFL